jgi:hypothetical protein
MSNHQRASRFIAPSEATLHLNRSVKLASIPDAIINAIPLKNTWPFSVMSSLRSLQSPASVTCRHAVLCNSAMINAERVSPFP